MSVNVTALQQMELDEMQELLAILEVESLHDFTTGYTEMDEQTAGRFTITNLEQLNWAFRKLHAYGAKLAGVKALADAELARINAWKAKEEKSLKDGIAFFDWLIAGYAARSRESDEKYKGEKTPYGKITFTKQQPAWTYPNEAETVAFLKQDEALAVHVKIEETVADRAKIKQALQIKRNAFVKGGEVVDIAEATETGWSGMQYMERVTVWDKDRVDAYEGIETTGELVKQEDGTGLFYEMVDLATGEVVEGVTLHAAVVVANGATVVPGVAVADQPDKIAVKPE